MSKPTQNTAVLALLRERGRLGLTPLEALDKLGVFRLSARVKDLRDEGYQIDTKWAITPHTYKRIACYVLYEVTPTELWTESELRAAHGDR